MDQGTSSARLAGYLGIAADAGYLTPERWRALADARIMAMETPPEDWLLDVSMASSLEELNTALNEVIWNLEDDICAGAGYIYLRFLRGDLSVPEMLDQCGNCTDSGWGGEDCEIFYVIWARLEKGEMTEAEATATALDAVEDSLARARQQLDELTRFFGEAI